MAAIITPVGRIADITPGNKRFFARTELYELVGTDNPTVTPITLHGRRMAFVHSADNEQKKPIASELFRLAKGGGLLNGNVIVCKACEII